MSDTTTPAARNAHARTRRQRQSDQPDHRRYRQSKGDVRFDRRATDLDLADGHHSMILVAYSLRLQRTGGLAPFMIRQNEQSERTQKQMENMTPRQRDQMLDTQVKVASKIGYVATTVGILIGALVVAGVLLLGFMVIAGMWADICASRWESCACVGRPGIIAGVLGILILFLKDPSTVDLNNLVASNVGAFMPDGTAKWLKVFLQSFDVFAFWNMLLMAFGFSAVDPKRLSMGKAFGIVFALFLVLDIVKTGLDSCVLLIGTCAVVNWG